MLQRGGGFSFAFFKRAANWVMFAITFFATVNRGRWWHLFWFALYENEPASCSSAYSVFRGKKTAWMLLIFGNSSRKKRQCALSCGEGCHKYQGCFEPLRCFRKCAKYKGSACGKKIAKRLGKTRKGYCFGVGSSAQRDKGERHYQRSPLPYSSKEGKSAGSGAIPTRRLAAAHLPGALRILDCREGT